MGGNKAEGPEVDHTLPSSDDEQSYIFTPSPTSLHVVDRVNCTCATLPLQTAQLHAVNIEEVVGDATVKSNFNIHMAITI